jgi:isochorismate synthase
MKQKCFLSILKKTFNEAIKPQESIYLKINLENIDLREVLNQVCCEKVYYFKSKYNDFSLLSVGLVKNFSSTDEILNFQREFPDTYLSAPLKFDDTQYSPVQLSNIYLGEWTFVTINNKTTLTIFSDPKTKTFSPPEVFFENLEISHHDIPLPSWSGDELIPDNQAWSDKIDEAKELFKQTKLKKIVLSRKRIFEYEYPLLPKSFFNALTNEQMNAQDCYQIFFQEDLENAFISLSPEKLFSLNKNDVSTIALASSTPRNNDQKLDDIQNNLLTSDPKLVEEHQIVVDEIKHSLKQICSDIHSSDLKIMKLSYIQHRAVDITATLCLGFNAIDLLTALHPTPAVGGLPKSNAILYIPKIEEYYREYYASPLGVLSSEYSEFAVAIRSGRIQNNKISIYAGAGILPGSVAEDEWNETTNKMTPFIRVINHE